MHAREEIVHTEVGHGDTQEGKGDVGLVHEADIRQVAYSRKSNKKRVCHKSMAHPLLCYLLHNPRSIVAYSKKGIILYRLQILLFPIFSIINRQEVHKRA